MTSIKGGAAGPSKENLPLSEPKATCEVMKKCTKIETYNPSPVRHFLDSPPLGRGSACCRTTCLLCVGSPEAMTSIDTFSLPSSRRTSPSRPLPWFLYFHELSKRAGRRRGLEEFKIRKIRKLQRTLLPQNLTEGDLHFGLSLAGQTKPLLSVDGAIRI